MTPAKADKIIREGKPVTVHNARYDETFTKTFVKRDRYSLYSDDGGVFERSDLEIVAHPDFNLQDDTIQTGNYEMRVMATNNGAIVSVSDPSVGTTISLNKRQIRFLISQLTETL